MRRSAHAAASGRAMTMPRNHAEAARGESIAAGILVDGVPESIALGLTPSRTPAIVRHLDVHSVDSFGEAVREGRLREVPGVGPVTEAKIVANLTREPAAPRGHRPHAGRGSDVGPSSAYPERVSHVPSLESLHALGLGEDPELPLER